MPVQTFQVIGMTCAHCKGAVVDELREIDGVDDVAVKLVPGGVSQVRVTSTCPLEREQVTAALDEAGDYHLVSDNR